MPVRSFNLELLRPEEATETRPAANAALKQPIVEEQCEICEYGSSGIRLIVHLRRRTNGTFAADLFNEAQLL